LQVLKFLTESEKYAVTNTILLKITGVVFIFTILVNFLSQIFGFWANKESAKYSKSKIQKLIDDKDFSEANMNNAKFYRDINDKGVSITNNLSVALMIGGLVILAIFFIQNF
jgi:hypothetical protein